jgi:3-methyladenine DNA glycosylase/8-oxoguanine DNA glycosylase
MVERKVAIDGPYDLRASLRAVMAKAAGRLPAAGDAMWWLPHTPDGPAAVRLARTSGGVDAASWGTGASWAIDQVEALLGADDDPSAFDPGAGLIGSLHRRNMGLRLGRTGRVFDALLPTILEQRVTSVEAKRSYRGIVLRYGSRAPGPVDAWVPPPAEVIAQLSYADLHPLGVERSRAAILIEAARRARRLEEIVTMDFEHAEARLLAVKGIGPWTAAFVMGSAMGCPDVVPVGDYHIPNTVSWALAGEPRGNDARMLELLEPYRPHRRRALLLLIAAGITAPRYGPKTAVRNFANS